MKRIPNRKPPRNGHPRSPADLQAARRAAAEKFEAIALAHLPPGWLVPRYRKNLSGRCCHQSKTITAPRPRTRKALYIFLHECAHAHLHDDSAGKRKPVHVKELEAEQWAHQKMREAGVPVPRSMTQRAKRYVARKIKRALVHGAKWIDPAAEQFAGTFITINKHTTGTRP
jgi:hypothetical protein